MISYPNKIRREINNTESEKKTYVRFWSIQASRSDGHERNFLIEAWVDQRAPQFAYK